MKNLNSEFKEGGEMHEHMAKYVIRRGQAEQLRELGLLQESEHYYRGFCDDSFRVENVKMDSSISAYNLMELGWMLGENTNRIKYDDIRKTYRFKYRIVTQEFEREIDARCSLLIMLLVTDGLAVEQVNQRYQVKRQHNLDYIKNEIENHNLMI